MACKSSGTSVVWNRYPRHSAPPKLSVLNVFMATSCLRSSSSSYLQVMLTRLTLSAWSSAVSCAIVLVTKSSSGRFVFLSKAALTNALVATAYTLTCLIELKAVANPFESTIWRLVLTGKWQKRISSRKMGPFSRPGKSCGSISCFIASSMFLKRISVSCTDQWVTSFVPLGGCWLVFLLGSVVILSSPTISGFFSPGRKDVTCHRA